LHEKTRSIGSNSRPVALAKLDGRTKEAALMRRVRADLIAHVGGLPTVTQRLLIERAVVLSLRVAQIDAKILAGESLTLHDSNFALAWNNALRRTLVALGIEPARSRPLDPMEAIRRHVAARTGGSEAA
jgi:hypothetical protein